MNKINSFTKAYQFFYRFPQIHIKNFSIYTVSQKKKVPTFELSVTLSNLNRMKFATKFIRHYPPHLVATLPWEIKNSNFLQIFGRYERKVPTFKLLTL